MGDQLTDIAIRVREAARDVRCWAYDVGRSQPPIDVVWLMAQAELHANPTITTYKFVDGKEIRKPGNVWIRFRVSFEKFAESIQSLLGPFDAWAQVMRLAVGDGRAEVAWRDPTPVTRTPCTEADERQNTPTRERNRIRKEERA